MPGDVDREFEVTSETSRNKSDGSAGACVNDESRIARREDPDFTLDVRVRDSSLVQASIAGDDEAFAELVRLYYDRIRAYVYHHLHREDELEDALQEIFIKAYQALPNFRKKSNFYTWLYRIASNYCIDRLRKRRLELVSIDNEESSDSIQAKLQSNSDTPEENLTRKEMVGMIRLALEKLEPVHQNIIVMREIEGLSYEEISETLEINIGTVKSRLARARNELRDVLLDMNIL
ncbi:MAG TPA: sigma-70 family RNA polymerase sigma factor [bacterium]|jgi:RNA polymerase sigma-70 factor (ECF subfamily)